MTENWNGEERRISNFMTHEQHEERCKLTREWIESAREVSRLDRDNLRQAIDAIDMSMKSNKAWLIGTLLTIITVCLGTMGYLVKEGGFARYNELADIKGQIMVIKEKQEYQSVLIEQIRLDQVSRHNGKNNGHK